ncbi:MAG: hypothetical protein AMXMBFR16_12050 [Candidatus Uhrbacteria bacterium]
MAWDWQETPCPSPESPETSICEVPFEGEEATESVKPRKDADGEKPTERLCRVRRVTSLYIFCSAR